MTEQNKEIDLSDTAILFIEFQKEWLEDDGKINFLMNDRKQFEAAIEGGRELLKFGREQGFKIIHSGLRFQKGHPELGENGLGLRGAIKRLGTFPIDGKGSEWAAGFEPQDNEFIVYGRTGGSAFAGSNLDAFMRANRLNTLLIAGFALHVCVESTLRAGHDLGYDCLVVTDATAAFTSAQRKHVLEEVVHHYGENISLDQLKKQF
ncbi:MAG: cysteine hydrolase [Hyphomicrobiales bacterium]